MEGEAPAEPLGRRMEDSTAQHKLHLPGFDGAQSHGRSGKQPTQFVQETGEIAGGMIVIRAVSNSLPSGNLSFLAGTWFITFRRGKWRGVSNGLP